MTFYTGKSADGSDMHECEGMYVSSKGKFWGSKPISLKEEQEMDFTFNRKPTRRERRRAKREGYKP